jgi:hypothetical protein
VDEFNAQPEMYNAPYTKAFRTKEKPDKLCNTFDTDPEFLKFKEKLEKPDQVITLRMLCSSFVF